MTIPEPDPSLWQDHTVEVDGAVRRFPVVATYARYLELVEEVPVRIEFDPFGQNPLAREPSERLGRIVAMAGGSAAHADAAANLVGELREALKDSGCRVRGSDMRVQAAGADYYPDVAVYCDPDQAASGQTTALTNPVLVIEVVSPSSERRDTQTKLDRYLAMPSVREYVLVWTDAYRVQRIARQNGHWRQHVTIGRDAAVEFQSVGVSVPMAEIYRNVEIAPLPPEPGHA